MKSFSFYILNIAAVLMLYITTILSETSFIIIVYQAEQVFRWALFATNANFREAYLNIYRYMMERERESREVLWDTHRWRHREYLFITIFINEVLNSYGEATCQTNKRSIKTYSKTSSNTDRLMNRLPFISIICFCQFDTCMNNYHSIALFTKCIHNLYYIELTI